MIHDALTGPYRRRPTRRDHALTALVILGAGAISVALVCGAIALAFWMGP